MAIHLLAFVLASGMAIGDAGDKAPVGKLPPPATEADVQLENAARAFRIENYETFHNDRAEYDRREAEGVKVQTAWTDAGRNEVEQPELIHWFDRATACSRADAIDSLPPAPKFTAVVKPAPEKKLAESADDSQIRTSAPSKAELLQVKSVSSAVGKKAPASTAAVTPPKPASALSIFDSLPKAIGAGISRTLHGLSGKAAPTAPVQGH